ncbi:ATP-binding protein [Brachybacterium sp. p3-SID1565]|uniref:Sensor-like histidine kinase SenX3 n=1 Tax=Brachybacterium epidermidis TaxID=2781983 RepID=A0ABR9VZV7_9MICO|nr:MULTISPECIES: ATP-binding protein [unclassified Brachybacterium]MBE9403727.1 ATP-binding protein [Brachybacterium epidermidis]MCT1384786.1 ATP-binding protein [Brachybacterium sp. p3-SID1565]MCT1774853.1 ATP-binding protein [Brachybacterium sp. p3-SID957]
MPSTIILLLAGSIGLVIGCAAALALARSERRGRGPVGAPEPVVPEPAAEVLAILSSAYVVLDSSGDVLRASPLAYSYGIVRATGGDYPRLANSELMELAADVGRNGGYRDERLTLRRSSQGDSDAVIDVRIGALGENGVLLLADDLTRAVRVEETRRDFVANVSHELKTPVGAITLLAETMEDAAEDPDAVRRFAERMQTESRRLSHLVQEIIELSRVQGTSALPDAEPVEIDEIIEEAVALNHNFALGSRITVAVGGTTGLRVFGSASMLTTAVSNLISNAITYSDADTRIGVSVRRDGGMVELSVKDQGIGISKENLERVFERFFRVDRARSRDTGGSGLGLAIVKHIATDHGGEVTAWSMAGQGSTFTLRIPEMGSTGAVTVGGAASRTVDVDEGP